MPDASLAAEQRIHVVGRAEHDLAEQHVLEHLHRLRVRDRVKVLVRLVEVGEGRLEILLLS
eukprot:3052211-Prymnesium_polylepis.1